MTLSAVAMLPETSVNDGGCTPCFMHDMGITFSWYGV